MAIFTPHKFRINARAFLCGVFLCACIAAPGMARASFNVTVTEIARMDWGTIGIPAGGSATIILHPNNATPSGTGTIIYGSPSRGQYKLVLSGSGTETSMTLDISSISSGSGSLALSNFTGIFGATSVPTFPSGTLALPATGAGTPLYLGATATVTAGQNPASLNPSFDIDIILN
jgi:hypothetical protein